MKKSGVFMDNDLALRVIDKAIKLGADYAEAHMLESDENSIMLKNSVLEASSFEKTAGIGARIFVNGTLGFFSSNQLKWEVLSKLVERAFASAKRASFGGSATRMAGKSNEKDNYIIKQKKNVLDIGFSEKFKLLIDIDKRLVATGIKTSRLFSYSDSLTKKYFANSEGASISSTLPLVRFYYNLSVLSGAESRQHFRSYMATAGWESMERWALCDDLINVTKALEQNIKKGVSAPKGNIDIVMAPEVTGIAVHESGGHPYEADRVLGREAAQAGESFITPQMIGKKIGSNIVNIVDDPAVEGGAGYYKYDDEGIKARRKFMVKNGIITELMHNRETAAELGMENNAGARASNFDREPIVRMSNTFLLPGEHGDEEIFNGIKLGVYLKNFMEWNIDDRRWSQKYVGSEAYLIRNGEIAEPVIKPALEITTPALYSAIDAVAKTVEFTGGNCGKGEPMQAIPVWMGGPHVRLRNIRLGGV